MSTAKTRKQRRTPILRRKMPGATLTIQRCRGRYAARVVVNIGGNRSTKGFRTLEEAKAYFQRQEIEAGNAGARAAVEITDSERRLVLNAKESLSAHGKSLEWAVNFALTHLNAVNKSATVAALIDEMVKHKEKENRSARHLRDMRERLGKFSETYGQRAIADINAEEISIWLNGLNLQPVSTLNYRRLISTLWNFGGERGFCEAGMIKRTVKPKTVIKEVGILTVSEAAALLLNASPKIRAGVAIGLFAGLRTAELERLDWRSVDFVAGHIVVGAGISKTAKRRTIPISENLRQWLEPLRQIGGPVMPSVSETRVLSEEARRAAGFRAYVRRKADADQKGLRPWPANAMRHSFVSHALVKWPDVAKVALWAGNSPAMIHEHYNATGVSDRAARDYWNLTPKRTAAANVLAIGGTEKPGKKRSKMA